MTNPFAHLGIHGLGHARLQYLEPAQTWLPDAPWMKSAERYDELVTRVLEQLREAAYPPYSLRNHRTKNKYRYYSTLDNTPAWSIGYFYTDHFIETGRSDPQVRWWEQIVVTLMFDTDNQPVSFECEQAGRKIHCGLSEAELIAALIALH